MSDHLGPGIESWLKATDLPPGDIGRAVAAIEAETAATPQRGRWWPLHVPHRRLTEAGPPRGQTMFSALKLFTAGVVVALFGGLLLAGFTAEPSDEVPAAIATASGSPEPTIEPSLGSPEPTATSTDATTMATRELIPGVELLVENIDHGVYRVLNDRVRDLNLEAPGTSPESPFLGWPHDQDRLLTGLDGSVWLRDDRFLTRLGERWPLGLPANPGRVGVSREGTLWAVGPGPRLYSYDGFERQLRLDGRDVASAIGFRLTADDDVWALLGTDRAGRYRMQHYDGTEWVKLSRPPAPADEPEVRIDAWAIGDDGTAWAIRGDQVSYFDGERWAVRTTYKQTPWEFRQLPEGGARALRPNKYERIVMDSFAIDGHVERLAIPPFDEWGSQASGLGAWTLAPDGAVWRSLVETRCQPGAGIFCQSYLTDCAGLARFDGEAWTDYLPDRCVAEFEFGPDGSVWAYASTTTAGEVMSGLPGSNETDADIEMETLVAGPLELYVITPETVSG